MEITEQAFMASALKLHSTQLKKTEGYTQDPTSCFIKQHRRLGRDIEIFLDYDESITIQARIHQARQRSERLRCEAADIDTVMPMFLKQGTQIYAVVMVLHHRFVNKQWAEHLDINYPDERVKMVLFDPLLSWFKHPVFYTNTSSCVFHKPSPLAALFAMVSAITLDNDIRIAPNHYSVIYADQTRQLLLKAYETTDLYSIQSLAYHMIPHVGRTYERDLAGGLQACLSVTALTSQHRLLISYLDKLLTQTMNLSANPSAASGIRAQAYRFDVHQRQRYVLSTLLAVAAAALIVLGSLGVMGASIDIMIGVSAGAAAGGVIAMAYLWERSTFRPPPLTCELRKLSARI